MPDGASGGDPNGYVLSSAEGAIYHAGDTALMLDMQLLKSYNLKAAFLPIGDHFTMGAADACQAATFIGCDKIIGIHYDTFPPISIDKEEATQIFADAGKELILLDIGQSIEI
jgi:L-ascorbate metabolism protein UlaG (beta-lactamase superfamily)